jgi:hypothetical protein
MTISLEHSPQKSESQVLTISAAIIAKIAERTSKADVFGGPAATIVFRESYENQI